MHFILQYPNSHSSSLADNRSAQQAKIAALCPGACIKLVKPATAYSFALRVENASATQIASLWTYCHSEKVDGAARLPMPFSKFCLLAMDMDSTLINIECIDEIAAFGGKKQAVAVLTERAMRGEIDFDESLIQRVALLKGVEEEVLEQVWTERLRLSTGAEALLESARAAGLRTLLVSGGFTFFAQRLQAQLGLDEVRANTLEIVHGKLTGKIVGPLINAQAKAHALQKVAAQWDIPVHRTIAIGDGANDLLMMAQAGLSIAFHAKPLVREAADIALNTVGLEGVLPLFI